MTQKKHIQKKKRKAIEFAISRIDLVDININCPDGFDASSKSSFKYKLSAHFSIDKDNSSLKVTISYLFLRDSDTLLNLSVENEYHIRDLTSLIVNEKICDDGFVYYIAELSINQTRGIQAFLIKDTPLKGLYIPPIPASNLENKITW